MSTVFTKPRFETQFWGNSIWPHCYEGLNGRGLTVRSQTAKNLTASRRKSINHQKSKLVLTVQKFLGTANLTFSADLNWTSSS